MVLNICAILDFLQGPGVTDIYSNSQNFRTSENMTNHEDLVQGIQSIIHDGLVALRRVIDIEVSPLCDCIPN